MLFEVLLQVFGHETQLTRRQAQATDCRALSLTTPCRRFVRTSEAYSLTRQISPSLTVIASLERNDTSPSPPRKVTSVLDERGVAVDANTVAVLQRFVGLTRHADAHVLAQLVEAEHAVLEEIVVLDVRVIQRHDAVEVAVLPAQVIAHDRGRRGLGLFRAVIVGVHKGLGAKRLSLPKFGTGFND